MSISVRNCDIYLECLGSIFNPKCGSVGFPHRMAFSVTLSVTETMTVCGVSGCIGRRLLDLGTNWTRMVRFAPGERVSDIHLLGWLGPRAFLNDMKNSGA